MNRITETKIGGLSLFIGTLLFLITVLFEYKIGWISADGGPDDPYNFVRSNWPTLSNIWLWQMVSGILVLLSYMMFFKVFKGLKSAMWAILIVGNLMSTAAFFLTLGSYGPALNVYDTSPEIFESIRAGISSLYRNIAIGPLFFITLFCLESFGKNGIIKKTWGIAGLICLVVLPAIGMAFGISLKISGLAYFILPLIFGYFALTRTNTNN